ncbi:MAG: cytochrome c3 family protein [Candidatus Binatia bacterium]
MRGETARWHTSLSHGESGPSIGLTAGIIAALCVLSLTAAYAVPGDIVFPRQDTQITEGIPSAVFPHWFHRIRYRCFVCHPDVFPMEVTNEGITMDAINAGKACGACHNGQTAWAPSFETCTRCHVPPPE